MIHKKLEEITQTDLQPLIDNGVLESKTIEYKLSLPGNTYDEKKEFLADISSFANTEGGDLIIGIKQDASTGIPSDIPGISINNVDDEKTRIDNIIRSGLQPRLPSFAIQPVTLNNSNVVFIIRMQKSWVSPHRVILGSHDKFYARNSSGKYPLDVDELRIAFNLSETITTRIKDFRVDRIALNLTKDSLLSEDYVAKIILHIIPVSTFATRRMVDIGFVANNPGKMPPLYNQGWNNRVNFDGFLTFSFFDNRNHIHSYTQLFRNGIIEAVEGLLLKHDGRLYIPSVAFEEKLINGTKEYLALLKDLNVEPPFFCFLSLINVKGYYMGINPARFIVHETYPISQNILELPEILIEDFSTDPASALKPCFDSLWNACGFTKSFNYDESGRWKPR